MQTNTAQTWTRPHLVRLGTIADVANNNPSGNQCTNNGNCKTVQAS